MPLRVLLFLLVTSLMPAAEPTVIPIWPEGVPDAKADGIPEEFENERVSHVQVPTLTYFPAPAERATDTAVIVCPGGGYQRLAWGHEGLQVAEFLNSLGVNVFILKYRLVDYGHPAPLRDVLRAVRHVRSKASEYRVDPQKIGLLGFSAGGHLVSSAGTLFDHPDGKTGAELDQVSARPDFIAPIYPVILMEGPFIHAGSRKSLLGENPSAELVAQMSTDRQVTKDTPPAFLMHTQEDKVVPIENTLAFYTALRNAGVPAEMHLYEKGPHGIGMRPNYGITSTWPQRFADWLRSRGFLPAQ